ncbi:MAG TPA: 4Fe-4S dicluster domain-containing protein, partial [Desulfobacterales bacterium]|nr:4Fe-4S dicluster domain-containing protein [Desulfobacterales bacterium]
ACPFNIPTYEYENPFSPSIQKCTLCQPRIEKGLLPGCVLSCPKEALTFGHRRELLQAARNRISQQPGRYIDHIYGEHEMGGTSWLYIAATPFREIGMREDLGTMAAAQLTAGPLGAVPIVVGLWPVLLTGIWAIGKRKDKIAAGERRQAVAEAEKKAQQAAEAKLAHLREQLGKEKETAVKLAVKNALEEAARAAQAETPPGSGEQAPKEEK